jgi:hypothetical protein
MKQAQSPFCFGIVHNCGRYSKYIPMLYEPQNTRVIWCACHRGMGRVWTQHQIFDGRCVSHALVVTGVNLVNTSLALDPLLSFPSASTFRQCYLQVCSESVFPILLPLTYMGLIRSCQWYPTLLWGLLAISSISASLPSVFRIDLSPFICVVRLSFMSKSLLHYPRKQRWCTC